MDDRRKHKRLSLECKIDLKRVGGEGQGGGSIQVAVLDLARKGIGFASDEVLQIGEVYEAELVIWTKETIHTFIEIVRIEKKVNTFVYGGIFVGMALADEQRIEIYETFQDFK